ncbi:DUF1189 domain-containing protein [Bacillus sp. Bva_UNVM-123]|uniref:DUF1189 domain-containing protein n=1 Tax=Bacillus sp. Bva_UNVM-123 TaxID=2829798 RepID=UPI00391F28C9
MNIFKQFFKSLYSPKDIALFRFQGIGKTILYVFLLTFLSLLPAIYYLSSATINGIDAIQNSIKNELPPFQITNGELQSEENAPIILKKDGFTINFDSTGTISIDDIAENNETIALLKNGAYFIANGKVQSLPYSMIGNITNEELLNIFSSIDSSLIIIIPIMVLIIYILTAGLNFIQISVLALLGLLLIKVLMRNIQYRHLWRIAAYSVTLPTIFFTIMEALKTTVPNGALINWFVSYIVLYLAIKEIPQPKKR